MNPLAFGNLEVYNPMVEKFSGRKPTFLLGGKRGEIPAFGMGLIRFCAGLRRVVAPMVDVEKIRSMAERVVSSEGLVLVDVELKGGEQNPLLRVYIDKSGGITHADCQLVSEQLSAMLDVEDPFPASYMLEVSSPGLDRKLSKPSDYEHFVGRKARLVLREPLGDQRVLEGRLAGFAEGRVRLDLGDAGLQELELANISKARLVVEM